MYLNSEDGKNYKCPECGSNLGIIYIGYENGVTELFHCFNCSNDWKRTFTADNGFSELEKICKAAAAKE